jgi:hypothetical protein
MIQKLLILKLARNIDVAYLKLILIFARYVKVIKDKKLVVSTCKIPILF